MKVYVFKNLEELNKKAASIFIEAIRENPKLTLGLATGSSPEGLYKELVESYQRKEISFKEISTFNLDEYLGLSPDHEESYLHYMKENLFDHVDLKEENIHMPNPFALDPEEECKNYEKAMKALGGIDLQLLGIGSNAHIGFNEPGEKLYNNTHITPLKEETRRANARFFNSLDEVPTHAITMGVGSIMRAKKIVLISFGEKKAKAIKDTIEGPITTEVPSSLLQLHGDVTILLDEASAKDLKEKSYELI